MASTVGIESAQAEYHAPRENHDNKEPATWPEPGPNWDEAYDEWSFAWPLHVYVFAAAYLLISVVAIYIIFSIYTAHQAESQDNVSNRGRSGSTNPPTPYGQSQDNVRERSGLMTAGPNTLPVRAGSVSADRDRSGSYQEGRKGSSMEKTTVALMLMVLSFSLTRFLFLLLDPYYSRGLMPFLVTRLLFSLGLPGFTASFSIMLLILIDTTRLSLGPPKFRKVSKSTRHHL